MCKKLTKELVKFLTPFPNEVKEIALWLRGFVWDLHPEANELIYDNPHALTLGWSPTDKVGHTFCSIAVGRTSKTVHFGFYYGSQTATPGKTMWGEGNPYRYILVKSKDEFPVKDIKKILRDAYDSSLLKVKAQDQPPRGQTITKLVSSSRLTAGKRKR